MKVKTKLIATIMSICLVCAVFAIGVFALKTANLKIGGDVSFTATGVNAEINTAKLTNGQTVTDLSNVSVTTAKTQSEIDAQIQNWKNLQIIFDENATDIELSFKIANKSAGESYIEIDYDYEISPATENIEVIPNGNNDYILEPKASTDAADVYQDFSLKFSVLNKQLSIASGTKLNLTIKLIHTEPVDSSTLPWFEEYFPSEYDSPNVGEMILKQDNFGSFDEVEIPAIMKVDGKNYQIVQITTPNDPTYASYLFEGCEKVIFHNSIRILSAGFYDNNVEFPVSAKVLDIYLFTEACVTFNSYEIPNHITTINGYSFCNLESLLSVTIPSSVTTIGDNAFGDCSNIIQIRNYSNVTLTTQHGIPSDCVVITDPNQEDAYFLQDGFLFVENSNGTLYLNSYKGTSKEVTLPDIGEKYVIKDDFFKDKTFTSVVLPNFITKLPSEMFKNCKNLASVTLPKNLEEIEVEAFANCTKLKTITIPASVKTIWMQAFEGCNLTSAIFEDTEGWVDPHEEPYYYFDVSTPALGAEVLNSGSLIANID